MSRPERDKILEHEYDGIREYDNPLPGWWLAIFYGSMIWAAAYFWWYHLGPGISDQQALVLEVRAAAREAAVRAIASGDTSDDTFTAVARHDAMMAHAGEVYSAQCAACHGRAGQGSSAAGSSGPNLADDLWLHGGALSDIYRVLNDGLPDSGHEALRFKLRPDEVYGLTAWVGSLRGTNPPDAKAGEGVRWVPGMGSSSEREKITALIRAVAKDPAQLAEGKTIFATRCMPCHGVDGQGVIGPNLADDYWIHGWQLPDIYSTISEGVIAKGMLSWKSQLTPEQMRQTTAYVASLRGTNPPNAKPPQGDLAAGNDLTDTSAAP